MTAKLTVPTDHLPLVLGRMQRLLRDPGCAESAAVEVVRRLVTGSIPDWLSRASEQARVDVLCMCEALSLPLEARR